MAAPLAGLVGVPMRYVAGGWKGCATRRVRFWSSPVERACSRGVERRFLEGIYCDIWIKICGITRPGDLTAAIEAGADAVGLVFDPESPRAVGAEEAARLAALAGDEVLCVGVFRNAPSSTVVAVVDAVGLPGVQYYGAVAEFCAIREALPHLRFAAYALSVGGSASSGPHLGSAFSVIDGAGVRSVGERGAVSASLDVGGTGSVSSVDELLGSFDPMARPDVFLFDSGRPGSGQTWNWHLLSGYFGPIPFVLAGGLSPENVGEAISAVRPWGVDVSSSLEVRPGVKDPDRIRRFVSAVRGSAAIRPSRARRSETPRA